MKTRLALGAALYHARPYAAHPEPLAALLLGLCGKNSSRFHTITKPSETEDHGSPSEYELEDVLRRARAGHPSMIVETREDVDDERTRAIIASQIPAQVRQDYTWSHDLMVSLGPLAVEDLGKESVIEYFVQFANATHATAGVILWAATPSLAMDFAMLQVEDLDEELLGRVRAAASVRTTFGLLARGPSWGTFINSEHVDMLGGMAMIERASGCARVETLTSGGAFLQLTEEPILFDLEVRDVRLERLARFLRPILARSVGHMPN
jgi:hypothetical protein